MKKLCLIFVVVLSSSVFALSEGSRAYLNHVRERLAKAAAIKTGESQVLYSEQGPMNGDPEFSKVDQSATPRLIPAAAPKAPGYSVSDFYAAETPRHKVKSKKHGKKISKHHKKRGHKFAKKSKGKKKRLTGK